VLSSSESQILTAVQPRPAPYGEIQMIFLNDNPCMIHRIHKLLPLMLIPTMACATMG